MTRVKPGNPQTRAKHKKVLKAAKGYRQTRHTLFRRANEAVVRAGEHAFAGRKLRKRDMRSLWITRLSGALAQSDVNYSTFISKLKKLNILLNRKMLSEIAIHDPIAFDQILSKVKAFK